MCLLFYILGALVWAKSLQRALKPYPTLLAVQNHQWLVSASVPRAGYCSLCGQSPSAARWCVAHSIQERGGAFPRAALGCKAWLRGPRRLRPCRCSVAEGAGPGPGEGALAGPCAGAGSGAAAGPQRGSRGSAGLTGLSGAHGAHRGSAGLTGLRSASARSSGARPRAGPYPHPAHPPRILWIRSVVNVSNGSFAAVSWGFSLFGLQCK